MTEPLWPHPPAESLTCQAHLQSKVNLQPLPDQPRLIAGVDASYAKTKRQMYGAVVVMSWPELAIIASAGVCGPLPFPYLPGLLSFREAPILLAALKKIRHRPQVILVDGQGIAHPRGVGLASHLGLLVGIPTIGCAKSHLWGEFGEITLEAGSCCSLTWKEKRLVGSCGLARGAGPCSFPPAIYSR